MKYQVEGLIRCVKIQNNEQTEIVETDEETEEISEQSNIDNTYFVLQKKEL